MKKVSIVMHGTEMVAAFRTMRKAKNFRDKKQGVADEETRRYLMEEYGWIDPYLVATTTRYSVIEMDVQ